MALFFASFHPPKSWKYGYVPPVLLLPRPRARVPLHARKSDAARSKLLFRPRGIRRPDRVQQPHHLRHDTRHLHRGHQSALTRQRGRPQKKPSYACTASTRSHQRLYPAMTWCRNYAACSAIAILPSWAPVSMSSAQWQRSTRRPSKTSYQQVIKCRVTPPRPIIVHYRISNTPPNLVIESTSHHHHHHHRTSHHTPSHNLQLASNDDLNNIRHSPLPRALDCLNRCLRLCAKHSPTSPPPPPPIDDPYRESARVALAYVWMELNNPAPVVRLADRVLGDGDGGVVGGRDRRSVVG